MKGQGGAANKHGRVEQQPPRPPHIPPYPPSVVGSTEGKPSGASASSSVASIVFSPQKITSSVFWSASPALEPVLCINAKSNPLLCCGKVAGRGPRGP